MVPEPFRGVRRRTVVRPDYDSRVYLVHRVSLRREGRPGLVVEGETSQQLPSRRTEETGLQLSASLVAVFPQ
ncbi:hypothetical protein Taro_000993 [Colocasia esculenta]|uniref:Uncharacterized protein n=1 Tax=Colocasia esculenta TaxID=4460 RepID=A0A843TI07_COLES|nr:hypothetical protein [Colocasia esculenta]